MVGAATTLPILVTIALCALGFIISEITIITRADRKKANIHNVVENLSLDHSLCLNRWSACVSKATLNPVRSLA